MESMAQRKADFQTSEDNISLQKKTCGWIEAVCKQEGQQCGCNLVCRGDGVQCWRGAQGKRMNIWRGLGVV